MSVLGHNQIRSIFERWQKLEEEKRAISDDLKDLFAEAKGNGFNGKALRAAFRHKLKMEDADERSKLQSDEADFDLYLAALGNVGTDHAITRGTREREAGRLVADITEENRHEEVPVSPVPSATPTPDAPKPAANVTPIKPASGYDELPVLSACEEASDVGLTADEITERTGRDRTDELRRLIKANYLRLADGRYFHNLHKTKTA